MTRSRMALGTAVALVIAWLVLWPTRTGVCLPTDGPLVCRVGARSSVGIDLGIPLGDYWIAVTVLVAISVAGTALVVRARR